MGRSRTARRISRRNRKSPAQAPHPSRCERTAAVPIAGLRSVAVPVFGGLTWLLRLEGRINMQAELHEKLSDDVTYIRARIDAALNGKR